MRCERCGRKGLFFKVNERGFCKDCEPLIAVQESEQARLDTLRKELSDASALYDKIYHQAKTVAESDIAKMRQTCQEEIDAAKGQLESELAAMRSAHEERVTALTMQIIASEAEYEATTKKLKKVTDEWLKTSRHVRDVASSYESILHALRTYSDREASELGFSETLLDVQENLFPTVKLDPHCMDIKELRKQFKQIDQKIDGVLNKYSSRYTTKSNIAIYKLMVIALRAELQNVLFSLSFSKLETAEEQLREITQKYLSIATDGNQQIAPTMKKFIGEVEGMFLEAVRTEYEYYIRKQQAKEEQKALREQMRQEAEERKRLADQQKQVEKEEKKYHSEIDSLREQLTRASDAKAEALNQRIAQLESQLTMVAQKKEEITRLQNGKAGYVYVISNLGSFGDDVFKVGMTRRLEPQERIDELGSASVPFPFDVHSFIFSNDAVSLENKMHESLNANRLNKVNLRKEFFKIPLVQLEQLVQEIDPTAEFKRTMAAEQFRQSLSIDEVVPFEASDDDDESA